MSGAHINFEKCAKRIATALQLERDERVVIKFDPRVFTPIVEPLQKEIRRAGAFISGVVLAEDTKQDSETEYQSIKTLFTDADVFIWLPELHQGNRSALARAIVEWLDAKRGRAIHFHWASGSYPIGFSELPPQQIIDEMYVAALDVDPAELDRKHRRAIELLQSGTVRVTTPEGTDISFQVGDRPFSSQIGDASRARIATARVRIDRDVELPAGVLRVAPIESSASGTIFLERWRPVLAEGRNLLLRFANGHVAIQGAGADAIDQELTAAGGDARMFREFALGFNPALKVRRDFPFIGYYGYGSGVVRLSLGDNEEMGGANRGGGVFWNFLHNSTVTVGDATLVKDGKLSPALDNSQ